MFLIILTDLFLTVYLFICASVELDFIYNFRLLFPLCYKVLRLKIIHLHNLISKKYNYT